jgi:esterase/lipase superfamily enzyme
VQSTEDAIFNEVVLAAPDMDAKTFTDIVPEMAKRVDRITLYASSRDKALVVSNVLHGEYQRAGESKPHPVIVSPIESIDVSSVTDGHSYIADDGQILDDLNNIFKRSRVLNKEIARPVIINDNDVFWVLGESVN